MDNRTKLSWWQRHKPTKRRLIQLYSALLYNAHLKGFVTGTIYKGATKKLCVPGLNCYSCPGAVGACPLGAMQNALGSLDQRIGFYVMGILMLYGLLLGRTICGWLCPFGMLQELLYKLPTPKISKSRFTKRLSYVKYILLVVFAIAIPLYYGIGKGIPVPGFCKFICPAGTLEGAMGLIPQNPEYLSMLGAGFTRKFVIMLLVGLFCVFCFRSFCRFLCPLGAIYGIFSRLAVIGVKVDMDSCNGCGSCAHRCRMDVRRVGDHECIHCAECVAACPTGAISMKAGNVTLIPSSKGKNADGPDLAEKRRRIGHIAACAAMAVLFAVLLWYNGTELFGKKGDRFVSDAPIGYEEGEQLADFSTPCLDGSSFTLSENRGKVVIINLWGTYCGPCVKELPFFDKLYRAHTDDIAFIAVHSAFTDRDVSEYAADQSWDFPIAVDNESEEIFHIVNANGVLPQTIVLNRRGEVVYNVVGSVSPELLEQLYEQAGK